MPTDRDRELAREWLWRSGILSWSHVDQESLAALVERSGREGEARALAAVRASMMVGPVVAEVVAGEAERALAAKEQGR